MSEKAPRPPDESREVEKIRDPKKIVALFDTYREKIREWDPLREKAAEAYKNHDYRFYSTQDAERSEQLEEEMTRIQEQVPIHLEALHIQMTEETPDWNFKYWIAKTRIDEQVRQAGSVNAKERYPNLELQSNVVEELLRRDGYDVDEKLKDFNWAPTLVAARDNLKKVYGNDAERASDYVLISHEILESN